MAEGEGNPFNPARRLLAQMKSRLAHPAPVLVGPVADMVHATFQAIFLSAGAYAGEMWEPLAPSTLARKGGTSAMLLVESDDLHRSLTERHAPGGFAELTPDGQGVAVGTTIPYAPFHQFGTRRMPKRQIVPDEWPREDQERMADLMGHYIATGELTP